ncbi:hypothetical protein [Helicobacter burdigaliensis]|uniref:hypothetical protein n=1 Tax=Helicobacter burdigaliensis TaxID=2315334 RepID=UPI000EF71169|nr:hypothetical protein [Helicobacter burdigaliensis]
MFKKAIFISVFMAVSLLKGAEEYEVLGKEDYYLFELLKKDSYLWIVKKDEKVKVVQDAKECQILTNKDNFLEFVCKDKEEKERKFTLKNGELESIVYKTKPKRYFTLERHRVKYSLNDELKVPSKIEIEFFCSNEKGMQKILNTLYGQTFDCKSAKEIFTQEAKSLMRGHLENHQEIYSKESTQDYLIKHPWQDSIKDDIVYFTEEFTFFDREECLYTKEHAQTHSRTGIAITEDGEEVDFNDQFGGFLISLKKFLWNEYVDLCTKMGKKPMVSFEDFEVSGYNSRDFEAIRFIYKEGEIMPKEMGIIELRWPYNAELSADIKIKE